MNSEYLSYEELGEMGFAALGRNVRIHRLCVIVDCSKIMIGDNVRVDPFTVVSAIGGLSVGNNVHISSHVTFSGGQEISIGNYCNISSGAKIYSSTDNFSESFLVGPMVPAEFRSILTAPVRILDHVTVGAGAVVLPGVTINTGAMVGALSLVKGDLGSWAVYGGVPAKHIKVRKKTALKLQSDYELKGWRLHLCYT